MSSPSSTPPPTPNANAPGQTPPQQQNAANALINSNPFNNVPQQQPLNAAAGQQDITLMAILALSQSVQQIAVSMSTATTGTADNKLLDAFMENTVTQMEHNSSDHFTAVGSSKFLIQLVKSWLALFQPSFKWPIEDWVIKFDTFMTTIDRKIDENEKLYIFLRSYVNFMNNAAMMGVYHKDIRAAINTNHIKLFKEWRMKRFNPMTDDFKTLYEYPALVFRCAAAKSELVFPRNNDVDKVPWEKPNKPHTPKPAIPPKEMTQNIGYELWH